MRRNKALLGASVLAWLGAAGAGSPLHAAIIASDNADNAAYAPQPNHGWMAVNGGSGYNLWTGLTDTAGGGTYMEGVGVNGRQTDGNFSFALFAGGGTFDVSRPLAASVTSGEFTIETRFDLAGAGPNLVNLRIGNTTTSFGAGELLSFGIVNNNQLSYTDSTGLHTLPSGEARGSVWDWTIDFDAAAGTYSGSVANAGGGFSGTFSGNLDASGTSVGSFAVINSSTGGNQNLIFDQPTFSTPVPEPTSLGLLTIAVSAIGVGTRRPRRRE